MEVNQLLIKVLLISRLLALNVTNHFVYLKVLLRYFLLFFKNGSLEGTVLVLIIMLQILLA